MIHKIKYLFFLILCFSFIGGISNLSAQTVGGRILVAGKKPLKQSDVNGLIEFYEWALDLKFSDEQRREFQESIENDFRADEASSRKGIDDLSANFARLKALDESTQRQKRETFFPGFLEGLKNASADQTSQLLLSIYNSPRESNNRAVAATESNASNDSSDSFGTGGISKLAGKWVWGRSGSSTYTSGGALMGSNGSRHTYQFSSNGTVEYSGIMNVMTGSCNMQVFSTKKGKGSIKGDTLTIAFEPATFIRDDSCSPSKNYKKTLPAETETYKVKLKTEYGQMQLCMTGKDETCFSKETK